MELERSCIPFGNISSESVISCLSYLCKILPVRFVDGDEGNKDVKLKNDWDAMYIEEQRFIRQIVSLVAVSLVQPWFNQCSYLAICFVRKMETRWKLYIWGDLARWVCATVLEFIVLRLNSVRKVDVFFKVLLGIFHYWR